MIGKGFKRASASEVSQPKGFDAFELRLGDIMRGERATMGKSLLDVQRELKIKASYIAAIENADPSAFDTPGFIAGYVRSYARYLHMDPDQTFATFCAESGFSTAHGMSSEASSLKGRTKEVGQVPLGKDIFSSPRTPFIPAGESIFAQIEPRAVGSMLVLLAVIAGLGYGGWSVVQEIQRVQFAPVEQTPTVLSELDPLSGANSFLAPTDVLDDESAPRAQALDRLYRPQALDVPVLVARDAPIASLSPETVGTFVPQQPSDVDAVVAGLLALADATSGASVEPTVQVVEPAIPTVQLVAVRPAWVRVRSADGTVIYEGVMDGGETFALPNTEEPATLRVGESGAMYFAVNGEHFGPVGNPGVVTSNVVLSADNLTATYEVADLDADADLAEYVRYAEAQTGE